MLWMIFALVGCPSSEETKADDTSAPPEETGDSGEPEETSGTGETGDSGDSGETGESGETGDSAETAAPDADGDGWPAPDDCDDADPAVSPDAAEVCGNGRDDNCDGGAPECRLTGELPLDSAAATILGDARDDGAGQAVALVGDLDGDGLGEIAVGVPGADGTTSDDGIVAVYHGALAGTVQAADAPLLLVGAEANGFLGTGLAGGADLDGDGAIDLFAGGWNIGAGGAVYAWSGPGDGVLAPADAYATLQGLSGGQADQVAFGDLDADGQLDAALASTAAESVAVFPGPLSGTLRASDAAGSLVGARRGDQLGAGFDVGDVDGDGVDDLFAGAPSAGPTARDNDGQAFLALGPLTTAVTASDADLVITGEGGGAFGYTAALLDGDGDGRPELVAGDYALDVTRAVFVGAVYVFPPDSRGAVDAASADGRWEGADELDGVGVGLAREADLDGDGREDLLTHGGFDSVWVVYGPFDRPATFAEADLVLTSPTSDHDPSAIASGEDQDGDGMDDLLIGNMFADLSRSEAGAAFLVTSAGF